MASPLRRRPELVAPHEQHASSHRGLPIQHIANRVFFHRQLELIPPCVVRLAADDRGQLLQH